MYFPPVAGLAERGGVRDDVSQGGGDAAQNVNLLAVAKSRTIRGCTAALAAGPMLPMASAASARTI